MSAPFFAKLNATQAERLVLAAREGLRLTDRMTPIERASAGRAIARLQRTLDRRKEADGQEQF